MMWPCKRLWLLFIVLLHLKDGRALGVWSKGLAWTWKASSFLDGAQISTAMKDESKTNPGAFQSGIASQAGGSLAQYKPLFKPVQGLQSKTCVQATSKQEVPSVELARPYAWLQKQNGLTQPGSLPVTAIQPAVSNGSSTLISYSGSQGHGSTVYGSSQQGISQLGSAPAFVVTQQGSESAVSNGSTASNMLSSYSGPQIQSSTGNALFQGLFTQYGGFQAQQSTSQLGSAPALTVTQQAPESAIMPNGSNSFSSSYSGFQTQTPTANWLSGFSSPYANFQMKHEVNQPGSVPVTAAQQASLGGIYNGSMSSSYSGSQSQGSTVYGLSQGIGSQFSQFQAQQGKKQCDSAPALTVTQQVLQDATTTSGSSTSSLRNPYTDSRSPIASWALQMLSGKYVGSQQGNQVGSLPGLTVTQQASEGAISNGSMFSTMSSSHSSSQSQGSTFYGLSQGLASQYNFQTQQGQLSPTPALVIQQALQNVISNDTKTSTSYSDSQNQGTTGYGLSQGLSSQYSGFQVHQGINQHGSVPALTVTQQASASGIPSGPTTSGMSPSSHVGSQNPFTYWLSLGLPSPYASFQTQHVQQLGSLPRLVSMQPATAGTISNDSSTSIFYSGSQYAGSQGQSFKQPGLTVIQQASANAMVNVSSTSSPYSSPNMGPVVPGLSQGSTSQSGRGQLSPASVLVVTQHSLSSGSSTSYNDSPIQGTTGYGLIQGLSSQYSGFRTQQGINQLGSVPALTVTQQPSASRMPSDPTTSGMSSGSDSGSKNPFNYWLSLGLPSHYANFQTQHSVGQLGSMPRFTTMQPIKSTVSNGSSTSIFYGGSPGQVSTGYGLSQGLASQYGGFQPQQGASLLSSAPAFILTQQASESAVLSGSTSNTSTSYSDSPTQGSTRYGLFQGLSSQYSRLQTLQGTNQLSSGSTITLNKPASSAISSGSSSYSGSQGQPATGYGPSLWLSNLYGSLQAQQGVQQAVSAPSLPLNQQTGSAPSLPLNQQAGSAPSLPLNQQTGSAPPLPLNQRDSESTTSSVFNSVSSGYSASQSHSSSPGPVGSSLSIQSQNVQKLGAFNQQVPALWLGQQYCKNLVYSASSDNSLSISGSKSSMGNISS